MSQESSSSEEASPSASTTSSSANSLATVDQERVDNIDDLDDIDTDISQEFPGVERNPPILKGDTFGVPLKLGNFRSVNISINDNDCLIHSFLISATSYFRNLTDSQKDIYAGWFRRVYFASKFDPVTESAALAEVLGTGFLGEAHIRKLLELFEINIVFFEKTGSGIRTTGNLGGVDDMEEDVDTILMYNPDNKHFRAVQDITRTGKGNPFLFSYDEGVAILEKYSVEGVAPIPRVCPFRKGEEVLHKGEIKPIFEIVWESSAKSVMNCVGVRFIKNGVVVPLAEIQKKPADTAALAASSAPPPPSSAALGSVAKPSAPVVAAPSTAVKVVKKSATALRSPPVSEAVAPPPPPPPQKKQLPAYPVGSTAEEVIRQWDEEKDFANRDAIVMKMKQDRIYPEKSQTVLEDGAGLYPDVRDPNFVKKILGKREFAESRQDSIQEQIRKGVNPCDPEKEFELTPVQRFVSRFLSPYTPYQSALLYHGVGVGKTCAAITIAEGYLERYPRDQVYIVAPPNIQPGFERTIFDIEGLKIGKGVGESEIDSEMNTAKGCTGNTYLKLTGTLFEQDKKAIESRVKALIRRRYKLMGYTQFANEVESVENRVPRQGGADLINEQIRKEYSGKVIIIDEAHNLRDIPDEAEEENVDAPGGYGELSDAAAGKKLTPFLRRVLSVAEGVTLVLLTGTPMYNSYSEIIFLLNLLLLNEKRTGDLLTKDKIFEPNVNSRKDLLEVVND